MLIKSLLLFALLLCPIRTTSIPHPFTAVRIEFMSPEDKQLLKDATTPLVDCDTRVFMEGDPAKARCLVKI